MISVCVLLIEFVTAYLFYAWALMWGARKAGSSRATMRVAALTIFYMVPVVLINAVLQFLFPPMPLQSTIALIATLEAEQILVFFLIIKTMFHLPATKAFLPAGSLAGAIALELALVLIVVRPFVAQGFVIPTPSMSPTMEPHDRFYVNKLAQPKRFDLIVYRANDWGRNDLWCKRLIGLPGERLRFENGGLFINDKPVTLPAVLAGRCHASVEPLGMPIGRYTDDETIKLERDEFFTIGDDVDISNDSRIKGPSKISSIVGVVDLIYWPPCRIRILH